MVKNTALFTEWIAKITKHLTAGGLRVLENMQRKGVTPAGIATLINPKYWKQGQWINAILLLDAVVLSVEGINWLSEYIKDQDTDRTKLLTELAKNGADEHTISVIMEKYDQLEKAQAIEDELNNVPMSEKDLSGAEIRREVLIIRAMEQDLINLSSLLGMSKERTLQVCRLVHKVNSNFSGYKALL